MAKPADSANKSTNAEKVIAFLTAMLTVVAALQACIYYSQLKAMKTDQRAWVSVRLAQLQPTITSQGTDSATVSYQTITINTGKTPALRGSTVFIVEMVRNGQAPSFSYDRPNLNNVDGIFLPNDPHPLSVPFMSPIRGEVGAKTLSAADVRELQEGKDYLALYGTSTYTDVFGANHWTRFCMWTSLAPAGTNITSRACTDYNQIGDGKPPI